MIIHKVIRLLREHRIAEPYPPQNKSYFTGIAEALIGAEKFDFGCLGLDLIGMVSPEVTGWTEPHRQYGFQAISHEHCVDMFNGLVPLPAPKCYFEFTVADSSNAIFTNLVIAYKNPIAFECVPMWMQKNPEHQDMVSVAPYAIRYQPRPPGADKDWLIRLQGDQKEIADFCRQHGEVKSTNYFRTQTAHLIAHCAVLLNSHGTKREAAGDSKSTRKEKSRRGEIPIPYHTIVHFDPRAPLRIVKPNAGGTHASPDRHWRKAHIRRIGHKTPKSEWSEVERTYVIPITGRHVGKSRDGSSIPHSHEYKRVEHP